MKNTIQIFEKTQIRTVWDEKAEKWWFSILDIIAILTDQADYKKTRNYWKWLKNKLKNEGNELVSTTNQLKLVAPDGKKRLTDVVDTEQIFRIIQSIPSKKAEPFKLWLAEVARKRIDQIQDPELSSKEISEVSDPTTFDDHTNIAKRGGTIAREARIKLELETGKKVITSLNAKNSLKILDKNKK